MSGSKFDSKSFNPQAFGAYMQTIPQLKTNELIKCMALTGNSEIKKVFTSQTGSAYAILPMYGLLDGTPLNYDGITDITSTATKTYERGVVTFGRAKSWQEKDFSEDITSGADFMGNIARQISAYWDEQFQQTLLSVLSGIFSMTGDKNLEFVNGHTYDISADEVDNVCGATTLNTAIQKACGANKNKISCAVMHSAVATNLENLNLLDYLKYTDKNGITRNLTIATWNGRTVIIDDDMPVTEGDDYTSYTTYLLGAGAIDYVDIGAKVPYEMWRDPHAAGGVDELITRHRKCLAPKGISYTKANQKTLSPSNEEFADGSNWELVHSGEADESQRTYFNHKAIPIVRIISRG